jgi:hypothetical protein
MICDCLDGLLAAAGTRRALVARKSTDGWDLLVSLCQTAMWLLRADAYVEESLAPSPTELNDLLEPSELP